MAQVTAPNYISVHIEKVNNLPEAVKTWGADEKGALSQNPSDHVFRYEAVLALPNGLEVKFPNGIFGMQELTPEGEVPEEGQPTEESVITFPHGSREEPQVSQDEPVPAKSAANLKRKQTKLSKEEEEARKRKEEEERKRKEEEEEVRRLAEEKEAEEEERDNPLPKGSIMMELPAEVQQHIEDLADSDTPLILTFRRVLRATCPAEWTDVNANRYKAEAAIHLTPFLEPGLSQHTFTVPLAASLASLEATDELQKAQSGQKKQAASKKPSKKKDMLSTLSQEEDSSTEHPFVENNTCVNITLHFTKPLVYLPEHRPRPNIKPHDIIPKRMEQQKRPVQGTQLYCAELQRILLQLADEWRAAQAVSPDGLSEEEQREIFLEGLRKQGLTDAWKEKLKYYVIKIVKEQFSKQNNDNEGTEESIHKFSNKLYVYLTEQLHKILNQMCSKDNLAVEAAVVAENKTHSKWKRLADEEELMKSYSLAAKYHQERLVHQAEDPQESAAEQVWNEYGQFCLRVRDIAKAEHAFREAMAINLCHIPSLIMYGLLLLSKKFYTEAEVFLQAAIDVDVSNMLSWSCLALFMELCGQDEQDEYRKRERLKEASYSYNQAKRLFTSDNDIRAANGEDPEKGKDNNSVYTHLADFLLGIHFEQLADHTLNNQIKQPAYRDKKEEKEASDVLFAKMHFQRENYDKSIHYLTKVIQNNRDNVRAHVLLGDVYREQGRPEDAEQSYERALTIAEGKVGGFEHIEKVEGINGPLYVWLGNIQMTMKKYADARDSFLLAAKIWPCGLTWMGVGQAYYRLEDYEHAEQSLNESNILNNLNPMTWAYLSLLCLKTGRLAEADHAFAQALKQNLTNPDVISEIGLEQQALGRYEHAEVAFGESLKLEDRASTRLLLGETLTTMRKFDEAKAEYDAIMKRQHEIDDKMKAEVEHRRYDINQLENSG